MTILENQSLKPYNTFHIDESATFFGTIHTEKDLLELLNHPIAQTEPISFIGGGSNILLTQKKEGLVVYNSIKGISIVEENDDDIIVQFMAGESWHDCVIWAVDRGYGGIENLSLIPGTIGAAPIQNIGAYGVEIKDVFVSCETLHLSTKTKKTFWLDECQFGYRDSIFKRNLKDQYFILSVRLKFSKHPKCSIEYGDIQKIIEQEYNHEVTIKNVSNAVIQIRSSKLPDPAVIGNAGSFFKNPVVEISIYESLAITYPSMPHFDAPNGIKIPAAWLIEQCGWKGYRNGDFGVHERQALVLVNYAGASGQELLGLSTDIITSVQQRFNILLEREVNIW